MSEADAVDSPAEFKSDMPDEIKNAFGVGTEDDLSTKTDGVKPEQEDDPKAGTTPTDGPDDTGKTQEEPLFAGKYKTQEEFEAGHSALSAQLKLVQAENKVFRETQKPETTSAKSAQDQKDDAFRTELQESVGESLANEIMQRIQSNGQPSTELKTVQDELANLHDVELERQYYDAHPEAKEPIVKEAIDGLIKTVNESNGDRTVTMDIFHSAVKGRMLPQLIEAGVEAAIKAMGKTELAKRVAGSLSVGTTSGSNADPGGSRGTEEEQIQRETFFGDHLKD